MSRIKRIVLTLVATLGLIAPIAVTASAADADVNGGLACGANLNFAGGTSCTEDGNDAGTKVDNLVKNVINIISLVVGIAAVVMIIIGGLRYVTSNGDSGQVGNAKNTILYAVVGLVVVALAQVIVRFVVAKATTTE
ncbi:MAG TPA: hypothetical protein PKD20_04425 [Candidatus Saccharibacteria bacterium]|jgi:hypothetical protein|nr:hypothetical protein [Candidatus Saccharibacteria bacterium]HMT56094.1 hypothetical protein [Candidatus Saccharibacteria bacterium]